MSTETTDYIECTWAMKWVKRVTVEMYHKTWEDHPFPPNNMKELIESDEDWKRADKWLAAHKEAL